MKLINSIDLPGMIVTLQSHIVLYTEIKRRWRTFRTTINTNTYVLGSISPMWLMSLALDAKNPQCKQLVARANGGRTVCLRRSSTIWCCMQEAGVVRAKEGEETGGSDILALLITMSIGVSHRRSLLGSWASGFVPSDLQTHVHAALARPPHFCRSVRRGSSQGWSIITAAAAGYAVWCAVDAKHKMQGRV